MKTAKQLQMSQTEYDALLKTRALLASGVVKTTVEDEEDGTVSGPKVGFNMNLPSESYECGSAMCIGGWMKMFMLGGKPNAQGVYNVTEHRRTEIHDYVGKFGCGGDRESEPLAALFYPDGVNREWDSLTPEEGVRAIDTLLKTGEADWRAAIRN